MASRDHRWIDWGGDGPLLHFAHANGFPPATYRRLVEALKVRFHVVSFCARPLWGHASPAALRDWRELAADLAAELDRRGLRGVVGVGHSLGGAMTFLAAAEHPGLFSSIVPVDPLMLTGVPSMIWGWAKRLGLSSRLSLVRGARSRRERWPSLEIVRTLYAGKAMFSTWQPQVFEDYLEAGLVAEEDGQFALRYPREWEARIFEVAPHNPWPQVRRLQVPTLFVRGERSDTFLADSAERLPRVNPLVQVHIAGGCSHFVPMEQPQPLAEVICDFAG